MLRDRDRRMLLAVVVSPASTAALMFGPILLAHATWFFTETNWRLVSVTTLSLSYVVSYTLGVPIYLYARRRRWQTKFQYMWGAFLMGLGGFPLYLLVLVVITAVVAPARIGELLDILFGVKDAVAVHVVAPIAFGLLSMPIGLTFWTITRPDQFA
jgi:hypothetical protein